MNPIKMIPHWSWPWQYSLLFLLIFVFIVWVTAKGLKDIDRVYAELNEFERRSKEPNCDLRALHTELVEFSEKECWNKHHGARAREISAFIQGKIAGKRL
jgi:hypothetical protein